MYTSLVKKSKCSVIIVTQLTYAGHCLFFKMLICLLEFRLHGYQIKVSVFTAQPNGGNKRQRTEWFTLYATSIQSVLRLIRRTAEKYPFSSASTYSKSKRLCLKSSNYYYRINAFTFSNNL
jgi:hypothetical protein